MDDAAKSAEGFDPEELIRVLDHHEVAYVLIGGVAARLHGSPSLTEDLDVTPERSSANLRRLAAALAELDARLAAPDVDGGLVIPLDERTFSSPVMTFITRAGHVDVVLEPIAVGGYEDLSDRAVAFEVFGIRLQVADLGDIIRSKEASGRPKDRAQLEMLHDLAAELDRRGR